VHDLANQTDNSWVVWLLQEEKITSDGAQYTLTAFQYSLSFMNILPEDLWTSTQS
jgi:hypothetical protein